MLLRKLLEEHGPMDGHAAWLSAVAGQELVRGDCDGIISDAEAKMY